MHALGDKVSSFPFASFSLSKKKKSEGLFSSASFLPLHLPLVDMLCSLSEIAEGCRDLASPRGRIEVSWWHHVPGCSREYAGAPGVRVFQWLSPAGCLQNNLVCTDGATPRTRAQRSVSLCRKGVHTCESEQEPAPQLHSNTNADGVEKRSPVTCGYLWRSWSHLGGTHVSRVAQLGAVMPKDGKTARYRVTDKEGLCMRNQDQELLRGFLVSLEGSS